MGQTRRKPNDRPKYKIFITHFILKPIPDPLPRPGASEYEEFKDYEHVRTVGDDLDSDKVIVDSETLKLIERTRHDFSRPILIGLNADIISKQFDIARFRSAD